MAKRKTQELLLDAKRTKRSDGNDEIAYIPSKTALDFRMAQWKTTQFKEGRVRIFSWNVNGLRSVMGRQELQNFIKKYNPDILCLNETKIDEKKIEGEMIKEQLFPGEYLQFWNCCKGKAGYSGTAILSKVKPVNVKFDLGIMKHDLEGRTITAEFSNFVLVGCYVPNSGQKLDRLGYRTEEWEPDMRRYLKSLEKNTKKNIIFCGDLNVAHQEIDIFYPKGNHKSAGFTNQEREEFSNLLNEGFVDSFRHLHPEEVKYSYWNNRSGAREQGKGWRLDYFVLSNNLLPAVEESDILCEVMGSDHCPIMLILDLSKLILPEKVKESLPEEAKSINSKKSRSRSPSNNSKKKSPRNSQKHPEEEEKIIEISAGEHPRFRLDISFVESFRDIKVNFGFNGLGDIAYKRSYSRLKDNGMKEEWFETVERVVNGCYNMQRVHLEEIGRTFDYAQAQTDAQKMYNKIFDFKFLPPGRGLWAMGTALTEEKKLYSALNNCGFVSTGGLSAEEFYMPFIFLMDMSMLGVGIGFDTKGANSLHY